MKTKLLHIESAFIILATLIFAGVHSAFAQGTAFTYQGRLQAGANPANGSYDLRFAIYDVLAGGNAVGDALTNSATVVNNGLFIATLDFGGVFNGTNYWLEIGVRTNGNGAFSTLTPRQPITPTPKAIYAANAGSAITAGIADSANSVFAANLTGTLADSQLSSNIVRLNIPNTTTQATGAVVVTSGFITGANVTNGGTGYTTVPSVTVADVNGSNAVITATVAGGSVVSLTVQNAGSQYSTGATLTIAPPPSNAYQTFNSGNVFNGVNTFPNGSNSFVGAFNGTFGNFSGGSITLTSNLNLSATSGTAGIIYSAGSTFVHAFGTNNFFAGAGAGNLTLTGAGNVGIGVNALRNDTSGADNTAAGAGALQSNTSGSFNTSYGNQSLRNNVNGNNNTAIGWGALLSNTAGNNTANGMQALRANTSGGNNTAIGFDALANNTTGSQNSANGAQALINNTSGIQNTANGYNALANNTTGSQNAANGAGALQNNTTGVRNTANGFQALWSNTSANDNTANGYNALVLNTTGIQNTANGMQALYFNTTGSQNTANGVNALQKNTVGRHNTANGFQALFSNTNGNFNSANGYEALFANTSGIQNTANGDSALLSNTTGAQNTANGAGALQNNTTGSNNIALGYQSGFNLATGSGNIEIGNLGLAGENGAIRIGTSGIHTNTFIAGVINGNGGGLTNINAATVGGLAPANFWKTVGNSGANPTNGSFLGTTDNQPFEIRANGITALQIEPRPTSPNVIAGFVGSNGNRTMPGAVGATISGGGYDGSYHYAGTFATVGGGYLGFARGALSTIGGGAFNTADGDNATIAGGVYNYASAPYAANGGGMANTNTSWWGTIAGGALNTASGPGYASVGGGTNNVASGYGATVPGGFGNIAGGNYSFAAGHRATATHTGAFLWADSSDFDFASTANDSFAARSVNGARFVSAIDGSGNPTAGVSLAAGGGAWSSLSDRNAKENFSRVDGREILQRVVALPLTSWNYKSQEKSIRHIGPMAQDFAAAFQVGEDEKHITTIDADGVALAAIQGLNQKVEEKDAEIGQLKQRLEKIEQLLSQKLGEQK